MFETKRLLIREFEDEDIESLHRYASNPTIVKYLKWGPNETLAKSKLFLESVKEKRNRFPRIDFDFCIELKKEQLHIGACSLYLDENNPRQGQIGYILDIEYWNKGFVSEAIHGLILFAKKDLKLEKITATVDTRNIASQKVMEKNGMTRTITIFNDCIQKGEKRDTFVYQFIFS